jgi:hypothetical protein
MTLTEFSEGDDLLAPPDVRNAIAKFELRSRTPGRGVGAGASC